MKYRILVFGMTENPGGVESFLVNYYRNIDRNIVQFDFLCNSHNPIAYEEELAAYGARMFHITARSQNRSLYRKELKAVFDEHADEWCGIWVNVCSLANIDYLKMAKKYNINKRIIHSHNSQNMDTFLRGLLHKWNKRRVDKFATDYWACSEDAAKWFYGQDLMPKVQLVHNAIDVQMYTYDKKQRLSIRKKLGISENEYVLGNVGRLHFQKNQKFIIQIFSEYYKKSNLSKLVLVGQGPDEDMLKEECKKLNIQENVFFVGVQKDICAWLSAFDLFLFPSVFEGLGVAALEAQANGLPVLASERVIPQEVRMNNNFSFYSLDKSAEEWAERICEIKDNVKREDREMIVKSFSDKGYEIKVEAKKVERFLTE